MTEDKSEVVKARVRWRRRAVAVVAGLVGAWIATAMFGSVASTVGPFDATFQVRPAVEGRTRVELAPLGTLSMPTHLGPQLQVTVDRIRLDEARRLLDDPQAVDQLESDVGQDTRSAVLTLLVRNGLLALLGGGTLAFVATRRWRSAAVGATGAAVVMLAGVVVSAATFRASAISEPRFTGLLTLAPRAIGDVREVTSRFEAYRVQANELAANVSRLYQVASGTNAEPVDTDAIRILHISDLHLNPAGFDVVEQLVQQFRPSFIVDTGDINDWGTAFEGGYADRISDLTLPYVYVRGNHDSMATQERVAAEPNAVVLDGKAVTVAGVQLWGVGDPRFTADKTLYDGVEQEKEAARRAAPVVRSQLLAAQPPPVDIAVVHDPAIAEKLEDAVPLVLAGHYHRSETRRLGSTQMLIEGSTGGAGLRGVVDGGESVPLKASILYLDPATRRLVAYDRIELAGLGRSSAQIERHLVRDDELPAPPPTSATSPVPASAPSIP